MRTRNQIWCHLITSLPIPDSKKTIEQYLKEDHPRYFDLLLHAPPPFSNFLFSILCYPMSVITSLSYRMGVEEEVFPPCATLIYSFPSLQGHYQIIATTATGCFPLSLWSHLTALFLYYLALKLDLAGMSACTVSLFLGASNKVSLWQVKWEKTPTTVCSTLMKVLN